MTVTVTGGTTSVVVSDDGGNVTVTGSTPAVTVSAPGGGVTDHGALTGLSDDDHAQYLTNARGDARYDALGAAAAVTASSLGAVPTSRTVNGHALSADVTVTASDVGADASGSAATAQAAAIAAAASDATTKANAAQAASQPLDSDLTAIAALSTTTFGRSLLTQADAAAALSTTGAAASSHTHDNIGSFSVDILRLVAASATSPMTNQGTWAPQFQTHPYLNCTTAAVNDGRTWDFIRGSGGVYTLSSYHWLLIAGGILTFYLDGTSLGTLDTYAASNTSNTGPTTIATGITLSSGWHTFGWKVTSKNASSSGYQARIHSPVFTRTA